MKVKSDHASLTMAVECFLAQGAPGMMRVTENVIMRRMKDALATRRLEDTPLAGWVSEVEATARADLAKVGLDLVILNLNTKAPSSTAA